MKEPNYRNSPLSDVCTVYFAPLFQTFPEKMNPIDINLESLIVTLFLDQVVEKNCFGRDRKTVG